MKLRPFGEAEDMGTIDTSFLVGYLESLISNEEERGDIAAHHKTPRGKRLNKAYEALDLLYDVGQHDTHP